MDIEHYEGAIEALLFAMGKSVSLSAIAKAIGHDTETTRKIIDNMMLSYNTAKEALRLLNWKILIRCAPKKSIMIIW